jgi:cation diffusion facilitator CzcD-associated flavoprotein CzcO
MLGVEAVDIAIIGAGPYGLSLAAYLRRGGCSVRTFGAPMQFWSQHMPRGMRLKSEGFATGLYDPQDTFTLKAYCAEHGLPYADVGLPVELKTFIDYALDFQRRCVPDLHAVQITSLAMHPDGFELTTEGGDVVRSRKVVIAAGIKNFAYIPPVLAGLPRSIVTHSSEHAELGGFHGRRVAVLGGGASALDIAVLLQQAGARVELITRRSVLDFNDPPNEPRPFLARLKAPRSGLGVGWRSRICCDAPLVFHALPQALRLRAVARHLGPAPCWFVRDAVVGRLPMHLGATLERAHLAGPRVQLEFTQAGHPGGRLEVDHVIAATGYQVAVSRLKFIEQPIQSRIRKVADTPILDRNFETSVPGLYFIGAAAANSFGPLLRFAYGARYAAERVSRDLLRA